LPQVWPHDKIRELLALADANGVSEAACASAEEAEKFRFAIYYFRRQHSIGLDLSITVKDSFVIIEKKELREVSIIQEGSP
jgi:hypothetical protein